MKKRAISCILCVVMMVTLLSNGMPLTAYAVERSTGPAITAEGTMTDARVNEASLTASSETEPIGEQETVPEAVHPVTEEADPLEEPPEEETDEHSETTGDAVTEEYPYPSS